jgi:hypothetical protein
MLVQNIKILDNYIVTGIVDLKCLLHSTDLLAPALLRIQRASAQTRHDSQSESHPSQRLEPTHNPAKFRFPPSFQLLTMAEDGILVEYKGNVAIITLNLPKKLNALDQDLYYKLATSLLEVAARDDITITVLTGKGRFFSA